MGSITSTIERTYASVCDNDSPAPPPLDKRKKKRKSKLKTKSRYSDNNNSHVDEKQNKKLLDEVTRLTEVIDEYKQSQLTRDNNMETVNLHIICLQQQIEAMRKDRNEMEQNKSMIASKLKETEAFQASFVKNKEVEVHKLDEENKKLSNIINTITEQMEMQKTENETLKKRLDEYDKPKSLQIKLDQYEPEKVNENAPDIEDKTQINVDGIDGVKETLETPQSEVDVKRLIDFMGIDDVRAAYKTDVDKTDCDSSYEEQEKLEIAQRKSFMNETKAIHDEAFAMQKEILSLRGHLPNASGKDEVVSSDRDNNELSGNENETMGIFNFKHVRSPSNLFRRQSVKKWDVEGLKQIKKEMEEQMVHLVESNTNLHDTYTVDTAQDERSSFSQ